MSYPLSSFAQIAQSVEQGIENPRVGGSIPPPGTIRFNDLARPCAGFVVSEAAHGALMGQQSTKTPRAARPLKALTRQFPQ